VRRAFILFLLVVACTPSRKRVMVRPAGTDERGVEFMRFESSLVERFVAPDGKACAPWNGHVKEDLIGWQAPDPDDPACSHDTLTDGISPGVLELRWKKMVPADGSYDLVTLGWSVAAWGWVSSRGSHYGDYVAKAEIVVEAHNPGCSAKWSQNVGEAQVTGPIERHANFSGYAEIPDLVLKQCKGGAPLEVSVRLVGEANRGRIEVGWFGFSAVKDEDANHIFGLRARPAGIAESPPR
jgi:hypothetical protein